MKTGICWLLLITMLLGGCANAPVEREKPNTGAAVQAETTAELVALGGYEDFMAALSAALIDGTGNKNLSPLSVYLALAMAAEGAAGQTQAELLTLLGEENAEDLRKTAEGLLKTLQVAGKTGELVLADSIWLGEQDKTVSFHKAYLDILKASYGAEAETVRFGESAAGERIAAWIKEKTRDKVKVSADAMRFTADTLAVLINTVYLKDAWMTPFEKEMTEAGTFHGPDGEKQVEYMRRTDTNRTIVKGEGFLRYALPLRDVGRMVFVLPNEGVSLESLLGSPEKLQELLTGGTESNADVNVLLPRFSFQDRTDLEEALMKLGVQTCFTDRADFSAMTDAPMLLSKVLQESHIAVDESGVTAAAYTMISMAAGAMPVEREKVDFHLTRPFLFAIESWNGATLFIGTVTAPDAA